MEENADAILATLGTGKWTIVYFLIVCYWFFVLPLHTMAGAFLAPYLEHTCSHPTDAYTATAHTLERNSSLNTSSNLSLPNYDAACSYLLEVNEGLLEVEPCTDWNFDNSTFYSTVTSEFQLVCGRKYLRATYQSMYMFGMAMGATTTALFADRFGRWIILAISTVSYSVIALATAWMPNIPTLLVARFLLGTVHPASLQAGYILVLEVTEMKMRAHIGLLLFSSWALGTIAFSGLAYLVRAWRWLQLAASLPCFLFLLLLWILGESPRWLAVVGQHQRALKEIKRAAGWNKVTLPPDHDLLQITHKIQQQAISTKKSHLLNKSSTSKLREILHGATVLIKTPKVRLVTVVMCVGYMVGAMLFFGLTLGASVLGVNPFLYMAIAGVVEFPSTTLLIPIANMFGRKKIVALSFGVSAVVLLSQPLISDDLKWLSVTLVMIGKLAGACAFNLIFLYCLELYPTQIRSQGTNVAMTSSRAGAIIAPYIMSALDSTYPWAISVVFGTAAAVAGLAIMLLWETLNTHLPDTIAELEGLFDPVQSQAKEKDKVEHCSLDDLEARKSNLLTSC